MVAGCSGASAVQQPTPDPLAELKALSDACASFNEVVRGLTESLDGFTRERGDKLAVVQRNLNRITHPDLVTARANMSVALDYWMQATSYRLSFNTTMANAAQRLAVAQTETTLSHFKAACT